MSEEITALTNRPGADAEAINNYSEALKLRDYAEKRVIQTLEDAKIATDDLSIISRLKRLWRRSGRNI